METTSRWTCAVLVALGAVLFGGLGQVQAQALNRDEVIAAGEAMALAQFEEMKWDFRSRSWLAGTLWAGVSDLTKVSDNTTIHDSFAGFAQSLGVQNVGVGVLNYREDYPDHADDMCAGQAFLDYYVQTGNATVVADTISRAGATSDYILSDEAVALATQVYELGTHDALTWSWIDALFMAAPLHARLSAVTGDPKYLEAMHTEWKRTSDLLYDTEEHLYYRDKYFMDRTTANGEKVFWSRGNGWVMGAFARTLPYIPEDDPLREGYITQFQEMAEKLASLQRPDGTWSPSLLDFEEYPDAESSGTALNCFAMAWGINNGILDEETYRPVVEAAWAALLAARLENGCLGAVQTIGAEPGSVDPDIWQWYGNGQFIMASVEVAELATVPEPTSMALLGLGGLMILRRRRSVTDPAS